MLNAVITRPVLAIVIGILRGPAQPNTVVDGLIQRKVDRAAQDAFVVGARLRGLCKKHWHDASDYAYISIEGLWALGFGGGKPYSSPYNRLFFTAGPNDENDGLFGTLLPIQAELVEADEP